MTISTFKGEKTVAELAGRLFKIKTTKSKELAAAEEALLKANPGLAQIDDLAPGHLILVPALTGAQPAEDISPETALVSNFVKELRPLLGDLRKTLDAAANRESDELTQTLTTLKGRDIALGAENIPELGDRLASITRDVKARQATIKKEQPVLKETLTRLEQNLSVPGKSPSKADAPVSITRTQASRSKTHDADAAET